MIIGCNNCGKEFTPKRPEQKYCTASCRVKAFNTRKNAFLTPQINANDMDNINEPLTPIETHTSNKIDAMIERILSERQAVYESKMEAMKKEYENKILELRLTDLERKVKDLESAHEESSQGIKMQDVMAGVGSYFATQMSSKLNESTPKKETK
jgi:hypothetical protein